MALPSSPDESAVWQAMVLFSSLATATEVWHAARERRAGRDPSGQEAEDVVRPFLRRAAGDLQAVLLQLQAGRIQAEQADEGTVAGLVRRYNDLMALRRVERLLHCVHQRLLSLYPEVSEDLVEEARRVHDAGARLLDAGTDAFVAAWGGFLHRALIFAGRLHAAIGK